jgi:hypothetical protein
MEFAIAGESLKITLTGTSLMNRNAQRDSYSYATKDPIAETYVGGLAVSTIGTYHPKIRARLHDLSTNGTNYNMTPSLGAPHLPATQL